VVVNLKPRKKLNLFAEALPDRQFAGVVISISGLPMQTLVYFKC
jgi:hypothetical protein